MTVNAVVVGAGLMGRWHARAARRAGAMVAAIVDTNLISAGELVRRHTGARAYGTLAAAFAEGPVDVVHVCTPLETHVALAEEALRSGAHVLIEKPFAQDADATRRVLDLATAQRRLACAVHQVPFQRGVREAARVLGQLGPLRHLSVTTCSAGATGAPVQADRIAGEILPHPLSLLIHLVPEAVHELRWSVLHPQPGEWQASTAVSGVTVTIRISMSARPPRHEAHLLAEGGSVYLDLFHGFSVVEPGSVSRTRKALRPLTHAARTGATALGNLARRAIQGEPAYPGLDELVRRFHEAVRRELPAPVSPEAILAVAEAGHRILSTAS